MIEFGETLRRAREAKGMSMDDVAKATHLMTAMVKNLENEDFSRIAAPIYGRGYVKLYCEAVGLDPKPLVAEFMDICNGNRVPTIHMRPSATPPPPALDTAASESGTAAEPVPAADAEPAPAPAPAPVPEPQPEPQPAGTFRLEQEAATMRRFTAGSSPAGIVPPASQPVSPYSTPVPPQIEPERRPRLNIPPVFWRLLLLGVIAVAAIWMLLACARALYRATMEPENAPGAERSGAPARSQAAAPGQSGAQGGGDGAQTGRRPLEIAPLYID